MDKSLFVYILFGMLFFYVITTFVGTLNLGSNAYEENREQKVQKYEKYETIDSVGDRILNTSSLTPAEQIEAWNVSDLKEDVVALFPNFTAIKEFIHDRVVGEPLSKRLLGHIDDAEYQYFSGTLTFEQTKHMLGALK